MSTEADRRDRLPGRVAVIGAAGGLGSGIVDVCRREGVRFTAIVRSRPERIGDVPEGSRVAVVASLADQAALTEAFRGADAVISAVGVTAASYDRSALQSENMQTIENAMNQAGVDRIIITNTLISVVPGQPAGFLMKFFSLFPGTVGRGAREQRAVVDALGNGAFSSLRWTMVRAGGNSRGTDAEPGVSLDWNEGKNSWRPLSYQSMGRWMLEEAVANRYVRQSPFVSIGKRTG